MVRRFNATSIVRSCAEVVFVSFSGLLHFHRGGKNIQVVTIAVVKHGVGDVVSWGGGGGAMTGVRGWVRGVGKLSSHASAEYGGGALDIATPWLADGRRDSVQCISGLRRRCRPPLCCTDFAGVAHQVSGSGRRPGLNHIDCTPSCLRELNCGTTVCLASDMRRARNGVA